MRLHYLIQNVKTEVERRKRLEWIAQNTAGQKEREKAKEGFGETINTVSNVGKKAAKGD